MCKKDVWLWTILDFEGKERSMHYPFTIKHAKYKVQNEITRKEGIYCCKQFKILNDVNCIIALEFENSIPASSQTSITENS